MVVRNATTANGDERTVLAPAIRDLAADVRNLAHNPGDRAVRQRAADGVLQAARRLRADNQVHDATPDSALAATVVAMRSAAADIMIVAGVDADQAMQAIQRDDADLDVPTPAPTPRGPFHGLRLPWKRREK